MAKADFYRASADLSVDPGVTATWFTIDTRGPDSTPLSVRLNRTELSESLFVGLDSRWQASGQRRWLVDHFIYVTN